MNFLLSINKKIFLIFAAVTIFTIICFICFIYIQSSPLLNGSIDINTQTADITKPKFSINSKKQKISVTANEGNFITDDEIMLKDNVIFKSNKFKIYSENVIFNKKNLIASSNEKSKFLSKSASIESIGFDIIDNGNVINFKGQTKLLLK